MPIGYAHRRVKRGDALYRMGDAFSNLYAVRSGTFKTRTLMVDGRDQVMSFPMSGDLLGFDGIESRIYRTDCIALEDSEVCIIPYEQLLSTAQAHPEVMRDLYGAMSREILREQGIMSLLGSMRADERVVAFLQTLSTRLQQRGFSASCFVLRMTREEIGSYLGLKLETVSRVISRLQQAGHIDVTNNREITLLDWTSGIALSDLDARVADRERPTVRPTPRPRVANPAFKLPLVNGGRPAFSAYG
jgi:CRP/FNR family transcriptional regulator